MNLTAFDNKYRSDEALNDFQEAEAIGSVLIGNKFIFVKGMFGVKYMPLDAVAWAYMRKNEATATICCGRGDFSEYRLMLLTYDMDLKSVIFQRKEDIKTVLDRLECKNSNIIIGYSKETADKFGI